MNAWSQPPMSPSPYASPYAPPQAWPSPPPAAGPNALTVLYTPNQIMLAAFLGAPIAGAVLLAINEQRLGRPKGVLPAIAIGFAASLVVFALAALLPDNFPGLPISMLGVGAVRLFAQSKQGAQVEQHKAWGGRIGSSWVPVGIGVLAAVVILGVIVAGAFGVALFEELKTGG